MSIHNKKNLNKLNRRRLILVDTKAKLMVSTPLLIQLLPFNQANNIQKWVKDFLEKMSVCRQKRQTRTETEESVQNSSTQTYVTNRSNLL